jgi:transposase-like protein
MDVPADTRPRRGRPRKGDRPPIPWADIEKAYVCGEIVRQLDDGSFERNYPSIRELAKKFGVHRSLVGYHSRRHNWPSRRQDFRTQLRTEIQQIRAKARALSTEDVVGILDAYLEKFRAAVDEGHVRVDSIADFNTAVRLKEFLLGGADSRQEIQGALTLEEMQARHRRLRDELAGLEPALAGVVPQSGATEGGDAPLQ